MGQELVHRPAGTAVGHPRQSQPVPHVPPPSTPAPYVWPEEQHPPVPYSRSERGHLAVPGADLAGAPAARFLQRHGWMLVAGMLMLAALTIGTLAATAWFQPRLAEQAELAAAKAQLAEAAAKDREERMLALAEGVVSLSREQPAEVQAEQPAAGADESTGMMSPMACLLILLAFAVALGRSFS
jgi:hypothetical protein